jgi:hypothetical protein
MTNLRAGATSVSVRTEASARNGETLSLRVAFWNLDLDQLDQTNIEPWKILEVSPYSEVYDQDWDRIFSRAVIETYHGIIRDPEDTIFGLGRCPNCGSTELHRSEATDYYGDETYYFIACTECGWGEG